MEQYFILHKCIGLKPLQWMFYKLALSPFLVNLFLLHVSINTKFNIWSFSLLVMQIINNAKYQQSYQRPVIQLHVSWFFHLSFYLKTSILLEIINSSPTRIPLSFMDSFILYYTFDLVTINSTSYLSFVIVTLLYN